MGLCISLPISPTNDSTLGERFFGFIENLQERKRRVKKESDWKLYYGSSDELKEDVKLLGTHMFRREILSLHKSKARRTLRPESIVQE